MISIIITALNEGKALCRTFESIFAQTYKDIEVIYINDGSNDVTDEAIRPYLNRVRYIKHRENAGPQQRRNEGIAAASGEYIIVCDADIVMRPDCLEKMLHALKQNPGCSYVYSSFIWVWKKFKSFPFDAHRLRAMNYINTASLVRKEHHPGFDPALHKFQDWDVWLTLLEQGRRGCYIPECLFSIGENLDRPIQVGMSRWLPSFVYRIPWKKFGIHINSIEKYEKGLKVIREKHKLES